MGVRRCHILSTSAMKYCVAPVKLASFATTQKILAAIREPFLKKCSWELTTTACCFGERLRSALVPYPDGLGIKEILSANFASTDSSDNIFDQDHLNLSLKMSKYLPSGKRPLCPQLGHKGHETRCKRNQWPLFWLQRSVFFWSTGATYFLHQHDWQSGHVCNGLRAAICNAASSVFAIPRKRSFVRRGYCPSSRWLGQNPDVQLLEAASGLSSIDRRLRAHSGRRMPDECVAWKEILVAASVWLEQRS